MHTLSEFDECQPALTQAVIDHSTLKIDVKTAEWFAQSLYQNIEAAQKGDGTGDGTGVPQDSQGEAEKQFDQFEVAAQRLLSEFEALPSRIKVQMNSKLSFYSGPKFYDLRSILGQIADQAEKARNSAASLDVSPQDAMMIAVVCACEIIAPQIGIKIPKRGDSEVFMSFGAKVMNAAIESAVPASFKTARKQRQDLLKRTQ
jgi:hypothetical protein